MDWILLLKFVGAGLGIFTAWKVLFDTASGKKNMLRDEYDFAKKFLDETPDKDNLHPFTLEKGYQAVAGTTTLDLSVIKYLLSLENPLQCLRDFSLSQQLFERLDTEGNLQLKFKKKYKSEFARCSRKYFYIFSYWMLSFAALSPILLGNYFNVAPYNTLIQSAFTLPFFGFYAWIALKAHTKIKRGEHLYMNQNEHSPRIIVGKAK